MATIGKAKVKSRECSNLIADVFRGIEKGRKISWYGGDYTTGVNDTFACCRSDIAKLYHLWNSYLRQCLSME